MTMESLWQYLSDGVSSLASTPVQIMIRRLKRCSVEIKISNNTKNITLRNPRTHFNCGECSAPLKSELSPGSGDSCRFKGTYPSWGVAGLLVYEAESFTVAIHFSNPNDNKWELGLELSPDKAHQSLEETYTRMAHGTYSSSLLDIKFDRDVVLDKEYGTIKVSHGPVKVMAAMSKATKSCLKVVLEEEGGSEEEAETENPRGARPYQEKGEPAGP